MITRKLFHLGQLLLVIAPGTLGITPDTYLVLVGTGFGERHIKNAMGVYDCNREEPLNNI